MKRLLIGTLSLLLSACSTHETASTGGGEQVDNPKHVSERVMIEARPVSLREMVAKADRILIGQVENSYADQKKVPGVESPILVQFVTFHVFKVLKAPKDLEDLREGRSYTIRQLAELSRPVNKGEMLLWYLAPDSELGLTQPIGIQSGDFRLVNNGKAAINLKANERLMDIETVQEEKAQLASQFPADQRAQFLAQVDKWIKSAETRPTGQPVPLDLLIARTQQLASRDK